MGRGLTGGVVESLSGSLLLMMHHSDVLFVVNIDDTCCFGLALCGWTIVEQSDEHFMQVDGPGIGVALCVDIKSGVFNFVLMYP